MILENDVYLSLLELTRKKVTLSEKTDAFLKAAHDVAKQKQQLPAEQIEREPALVTPNADDCTKLTTDAG